MKTVTVKHQGQDVPVTLANTVIVGAGAAAMNCAVKLVELWQSRGVKNPAEKLLVVTGGLSLGASRMSGSDKQTYYKMGTSPRIADTAVEFAQALTGFGCCHGDLALAEGIGSLRGFYHLVEVGVPFPHDPWGAFIGYKTDHDPYERATSAGPKTSKFMSECLQAKAERMGIRIVDKHPVVRFVTEGQGKSRRIRALICIDRKRAKGDDAGLAVFAAENFVLAGGGPGEIYKTTVYPRGQYGFHGPAMEAGLEGCNLTESQYGLASTKFRWNVSGTYMQVVPRIFSTDSEGGDEREFLTDYFPDMPSMVSNIFLKGYQWPFDAQRITDHQSTLVDMAVHVETVFLGRRVYMDFLRNPVGPKGWAAFDISKMSSEAREYLEKTGALQKLPIERLQHMNQPAIEIYSENGIDLTREPLEIAVCAQHMNGGLAVNKWWESTVRHTFVIGEMAGTHGVKRPGGSALNAGQVGASRAAQYIAAAYGSDEPDVAAAKSLIAASLKEGGLEQTLLSKRATATATATAIMAEIGERMTRHGAHLRSREGVATALSEACAQYDRLLSEGLKFAGAKQLPEALVAVQQCLTQIALLKAISVMFERGAGSRGSHCILDPKGIDMHPRLLDPSTGAPLKFKPENEALRGEIVQLRYDAKSADRFSHEIIAPRAMPQRDIAFEPAWTEYRDGKVFKI